MTTLSDVLAAVLAGGYQPFGPIALVGGQAVDKGCGIIELQPAVASGPATIISAGIHGNETAPLELLVLLARALDSEQLTIAAPTLLIVGHPPAIVAGTRYLQTNLNRLFCRGPTSEAASVEQLRATELMTAVDRFWAVQAASPGAALHLDMHTAIRASQYPRFVVQPFSDVATPGAVWQALAGAGMQAVLSQHKHSWTFSHYSRYYHQVVSFTLELGRVARFGANDLTLLAGMQRWLAARIGGQPAELADPSALACFQVIEELMRDSDDFALAFAPDTPNFTRFDVGQTIARRGNAPDTVVRDAPLHVVFPNAQVERGARAALLARPITAPNRLE